MDITVSKNSFNHALLYSIVFLIPKFKVKQLERLRSILNDLDHPCVSSTLELYTFGICWAHMREWKWWTKMAVVG